MPCQHTETRACVVCGAAFTITPCKHPGQRCCSRSCGLRLAHARTAEEVAASFWAKVDRSSPTGCWPWLASCDADGYGYHKWDRKTVKAHRVAWFLTHGEWPRLPVLHTCDSPSCQRPEHLVVGTFAANSADMVSKGRQCRGARHPNTHLTETDIRAIRAAHTGRRGTASSRVTSGALAHQYAVSTNTIWRIVTRKVWKHVI